MNDNEFKLGETMHPGDAIFDEITFQQIIDAVYHNGSVRDEAAVRKVAKEILQERLEDYWFLIQRNMEEIVRLANPYVRQPLCNAPGWDSERLERLAREVYEYLLKHEMWIDISIYYDGKRMSTSRCVDGKWESNYNGEPFIEENIDPRDYFEYVADPHVLSMSFESSFYDIINYHGGPILDGFTKLFDRYGLWYEQGDAWNLSVYGD